jgi:hypothetical protein
LISFSLFCDQKTKQKKGSSSLGQIGQGSTTMKQIPSLIRDLQGINVLRVSAGATHTLFLSDAAKVFCGKKKKKTYVIYV